jgi:uncharacterized membrane protein YuzA (DUF378 family)
MDLYTQKYLNLLTLILVIFGAFQLSIIGLFNINILKIISKHTFIYIEKVIYILIGLSVIFNIFNRNYYLPFLGDSAFPCGLFEEKLPNHANIKVFVHTPPHSGVIYWAAETNNNIIQNPSLAYGSYTNVGITKSDGKGLTILNIRRPASYKTPFGKILKPHAHYRVCTNNGMLSSVKTVFINSGNTVEQEK